MRGSKKQAVRRRIKRACCAVTERLEERTLLSTIYVDASAATGAHNGSSWANAYQDLQQGLWVAVSGDRILVAGGTYKPTTTTNRGISFQLKTGVELDGGYAGDSSPSNADARDLATYPSILSGDIGAAGDSSDNSYHVVLGSGANNTAVIDGFTIRSGRATSVTPNDSGGGIYGGSPTVRNCTFIDNSAVNGGAVYGSTKIIQSLFIGNSASNNGGAVYLSSGALLVNSTLIANKAFSGGGAYVGGYPSGSSVSNSILWGNTGTYSPQITGTALSVTYSDIQGGYTGIGNIRLDPKLLRSPNPGADSVWGSADDDYGDLRLQQSSPCIDAGNNGALPVNVTMDLAGTPRFTDVPSVNDTGTGISPMVDLGAYEFFGVSFVVHSQTVRHGAGAAVATVSLSTPLAYPVTVPLVFGGSAQQGIDYTVESSFATFDPGVTGVLVTLTFLQTGFSQGDGTITLTLGTPSDASLQSGDTYSVLVTGDHPPILNAIADKTIGEGSLLSFTATASDADLPGDTLTYSLDPGAPAGASVNPASGLFTWTPTEAQGPGTYIVTVRVTDDDLPPLTDSKTFTVTVNETNQAPTLAAITDKNIDEGSTLRFAVAATDADIPVNTLTYGLTSAPPGASIDPATGLFTWTPGEAQGPGAYDVTVRVMDNGSPALSDSTTFKITVNEVNQAPVLSAIADKTISEGSTLSFTASAYDPDVPANAIIYSLDGGAPAGASIDPTTGLFVFTPADSGIYNLIVRATDSGSPALSDAKSFSVIVNNVVPTATFTGNKTISEGASPVIGFTNPFDPSSADTSGGFHYSLALSIAGLAGDYASALDPASKSFTFAQAGSFVVYGRIFDKDNGYTQYSSTIIVNDVPATIALSGANSVDEGSTYTLTLGPITDPGNETVTQWLVYWGDGQSDSYSSGGDVTHVYRDGPLNAGISVSLVDELGRHDNCASKSVTVNNVPPTLAISGSDKTAVGTDYVLTLSSSDPGQDSISSWTINWGDGKIDVSTPGLAAVAGIHRYYATGNYTITATATDEDGTYSAPQSVSVQVLDKPSISGYVYHDLNGNGQKDNTEVGLNQWMVFFDTSGDGKWQSGETYALSDSTGLYSFRNLTPGAYHLACAPLSSLWKASTASSVDLTVDYGDKLTGQNFGFYQPASISGNLFRDDNGNGKKEGNEPNLPGWRVYLDADKDGAFDNGEASVLTDSSGNYSLTGLLPGSYLLSYILASGWKAISPASGYVDITVSSAGKAAQNFAIQALPASISGVIFNDQNASTIKDATEPGLLKWQVFLDFNHDGQLSVGEPNCLTDAYGRYSFTGLFPGSYLLRTIVPFGWKNSPASSMEIPTAAGTAIVNKNLGFYQLASISGSVFNDLSGEGTKNTGELGLASRQVFLDANKNGKLDAGEKSLLSDSAGRYTFTNLIPGSYRVATTLPAGWRTSSPAIAYYDIALLGGQVLTAKDFGQTQKTLITGTVWNDVNSNAIRDPADAGLYNYRVFIDLDKDGTWDANEPSVLTDKLRNFTFSTLAAGTYTIRVAAPKGYRVTYPKVGYYNSALNAGQALALTFGVGK